MLKVNRLSLTGNALAFTLSGTVTGPVKNPLIDGRFDGRLQLAALPRALWERLQLDCTGTLTGSTSIRMHLADLTSERLHYVNASGKVGLDGFRIDSHADSIDFHAFTRHASMEFGTASKADYDSITVDSLLRVRLTADTLAFTGEGMALTGTDLSIRAAARNTGSLLDTTRVTPVGFTIGAGRLAHRHDEYKSSRRIGQRHPAAVPQQCPRTAADHEGRRTARALQRSCDTPLAHRLGGCIGTASAYAPSTRITGN